MVEGPVELVDGLRPEGVEHLRAIKGDPNRSVIGCTVIGDVGKIERLDLGPGVRVEQLGNHGYGGLQRIDRQTVIGRFAPAGATDRALARSLHARPADEKDGRPRWGDEWASHGTRRIGNRAVAAEAQRASVSPCPPGCSRSSRSLPSTPLHPRRSPTVSCVSFRHRPPCPRRMPRRPPTPALRGPSAAGRRA